MVCFFTRICSFHTTVTDGRNDLTHTFNLHFQRFIARFKCHLKRGYNLLFTAPGIWKIPGGIYYPFFSFSLAKKMGLQEHLLSLILLAFIDISATIVYVRFYISQTICRAYIKLLQHQSILNKLPKAIGRFLRLLACQSCLRQNQAATNESLAETLLQAL